MRTVAGGSAAAGGRGVSGKKKPRIFPGAGLFLLIPGGDLLSHIVTHAVPSALRDFTSVFGMGTGVTPSALPPRNSAASAKGRLRRCLRRILFTVALLRLTICSLAALHPTPYPVPVGTGKA